MPQRIWSSTSAAWRPKTPSGPDRVPPLFKMLATGLGVGLVLISIGYLSSEEAGYQPVIHRGTKLTHRTLGPLTVIEYRGGDVVNCRTPNGSWDRFYLWEFDDVVYQNSEPTVFFDQRKKPKSD